MLSTSRHASSPASSSSRRRMLDSATRERALLVAGGAAVAALLPAIWRRLQRRGVGPAVGPAAAAAAADPTRSTTSSAGGGVGAYETRKAVDEYLQFHYGKPEEILPYELGPKVGGCGCMHAAVRGERSAPGRQRGCSSAVCCPHMYRLGLQLERLICPVLLSCLCRLFAHARRCRRPPPALRAQDALRFTEEIALLCERHCGALQDFTGACKVRSCRYSNLVAAGPGQYGMRSPDSRCLPPLPPLLALPLPHCRGAGGGDSGGHWLRCGWSLVCAGPCLPPCDGHRLFAALCQRCKRERGLWGWAKH